MTYILNISAAQQPFDLGTDNNNRHVFSCNFDCVSLGPDGQIESDFSALLSTPFSGAIFLLGAKVTIPPPTHAAIADTSTDGPFIRIISTGGTATELGRGGNTTRIEHPSVQILVSSLDSELASTTATSIWRLLDGLCHSTV